MEKLLSFISNMLYTPFCNNKKKNHILTIASICMAVLMIVSMVAMVMSTQYTFFQHDDFGVAGAVESRDNGNRIVSALSYAGEVWTSWGGGGLTLPFYAYLVSPVSNGGEEYLHILLAVEMIVFFVTIVLLLNVLFDKILSGRSLWLVICCVCLLFLNSGSYGSVYQFFVGSTYEVSLCILCMALFLFLKNHDKPNIVILVMTVLFAFLSMTCSLLSVASGIAFLFLELLYFANEKQLKKRDILLFLLFVAFGMLNILAPGNFSRKTYMEESISIFTAVVYSARSYVIQIEWLFKDTPYVLVFMIEIITGLLWGRKGRDYKRGIVNAVLIMIVVPMVTVLPFVYGYGQPYVAERALFSIRFFLIIGWSMFALELAGMINNLLENECMKKIVVLTSGFLFFIALCTSPFRIEDAESYIIAKNISNGSMKSYYEDVQNLYAQIEESSESDVLLELPDPVDGLVKFELYENPDEYANSALAARFGKDSVRITEYK